MKPKELVLDMDETLPKFVEKTLDISANPSDPKSAIKTSHILEDLDKQEQPSMVRNNIENIPPKEEPESQPEVPEKTPIEEMSTTLIKEDIPLKEVAKTEQEEEPRDWKDDLRDKAKENLEFFLEYFTGFVIGVSLSLLGYKFVKFVNKKSRTRKGLLAGCMVSFLLIFLLCIFYMSYTRDVLLVKRSWRKHHRTTRHLKLPGFSSYLSYNISTISHGIGAAFSSLLPHFSYTHSRHRRSHLKTQRKIKALKHMRTRIHRHLRVLL
jgi:hypothetical protein